MVKFCLLISLLLVTVSAFSQQGSIQKFISDSSMLHASVSLCIKDTDNGEIVSEFNKGTSLIPASVMKLITSGAALELLGPQHTFRTTIGYTGTLNKRTGRLSGDIVITGGGDPALGSEYFTDHYSDFLDRWVATIKKTGIKKVVGRIITDDSYFDFFPVSGKWQWEDLGNYYGAGVYGLSVFDNSVEIHLKTSSDSTTPVIMKIIPDGYNYNYLNRLTASGNTDEGYVLAAPYSNLGWMTGSVPSGEEDFILKGSMSDPPLLIAGLLNEKLKASGIKTGKNPTTVRLEGRNISGNPEIISELESPPLSDIIEVLNHESVNLYAETLLKELGKRFRGTGSADSGLVVVNGFLMNAGISADGMYIGDGSGLSPRNAINSEGLTNFLSFMKNKGEYFPVYFNSLPEAGKEGTLKAYFRDVAFESRMRAKSGSMGRVRCYAGYIRTNSGRNMVFSILVNNFSGSSQHVISGIEEIIKDIILYK